ncbi:OmpA family protein [Variovorax sp. ZT4R33]|uniref:OmpA family protein n=1 Tax=Variovorax sp. ZT4R33 TaxID=3443743 RepID=UPI003F45C375
MFDELIKEIASRFALGHKAGDLVRLLLAAMADARTGGLSGFADRFRQAGADEAVQDWLTPAGPMAAPVLSATQVESVLGGPGGLVGRIAERLGSSPSIIASAIALAAPTIMRRLAAGGRWPTLAPTELEGMVGTARATPSAERAEPQRRSGFFKWLAWLLVALAAILLIVQCRQLAAGPGVPTAARAVASAAAGAVQATLDAIPSGAGALAAMVDGQPALKVYFDTGKSDISPEFAERAKPLVEFLRAHGGSQAVVSGYSDPTGGAAANAAMSQQRAQAVSAALQAAGLAESSIVLQKPVDITGSGDTHAESRRVEVTIRK